MTVPSHPKKLLNSLFLLCGLWALCQQCPGITYPADGEPGIPVDATITWPAVGGINGYLLSLGTTPGGIDILERKPTGTDNFYKAPVGLPEGTDIYVSLSLLRFDGDPITCPGTVFTTVDVTTPPPCTVLIAPDNNATNVTIITDITWAYAPTATYYLLSIGMEPGGVDILDNYNVGNVLTYEPPEDLPQDSRIYVTVVPRNENSGPSTCSSESFFTGPAMDYCLPYTDEQTGATITPRPTIQFPSQVGICSDELPYVIGTTDVADGFRWYSINAGASETLIAEGPEVPIAGPGRYRYEAYNTLVRSGHTVECGDSKLFTVVVSEMATIDHIIIHNFPEGRQIIVLVSGSGNYEFALDSPDGPYQNGNLFQGIPAGLHTAYVRDKNGCGIARRVVDRDISRSDFPNFFTPNEDGINDYWHFIPPAEDYGIIVEMIAIFDRFGNMLAQIVPESRGWDGKFNGRPLPSSDYWFRAMASNGQEIKGHFALKR